MTRFYSALISVAVVMALILCVPLMQVRAQAPAGAGAVAKVVKRMASLGSFKADLSMSSGAGFLRGTLSYQAGKVNFRLGDGRVIAGNGKFLTVYSPATGVAGKQPMSRGSGGLGWVLSGFQTKVRGNSAELTALDPGQSVQKVLMTWNAGYVLRRLSIQRKGSDRFLTIQIGRITPVRNFGVNVFSWRPPAGSRTVENPQDQRN